MQRQGFLDIFWTGEDGNTPAKPRGTEDNANAIIGRCAMQGTDVSRSGPRERMYAIELLIGLTRMNFLGRLKFPRPTCSSSPSSPASSSRCRPPLLRPSHSQCLFVRFCLSLMVASLALAAAEGRLEDVRAILAQESPVDLEARGASDLRHPRCTCRTVKDN